MISTSTDFNYNDIVVENLVISHRNSQFFTVKIDGQFFVSIQQLEA
jgi:hypothetical protein